MFSLSLYRLVARNLRHYPSTYDFRASHNASSTDNQSQSNSKYDEYSLF